MKLLFSPKFDLVVDIITSRAKEMENVIQLQWGELSTVPPGVVEKFFVEAFRKQMVRYTAPHGNLELRRVILNKVRRRNSIDANIDNIIVTVGGTAAINFIFRIVAGDGGFIIIQDPAWFGYPSIAHYVGAKIFRVKENAISYDTLLEAKKRIENSGGDLRAIVLNYPSNPTGFVFNIETLKEVLDFAEEYDLLVVSDEAYEDYVFSGKHTSIASIGGLENVVAVYTISKSYSFTGLRIGYAVARKDIIDAMALAQVHTYISPPAINQYVAKRLLEENIGEEIIKENTALLKRNLCLAIDLAEEYGWEYVEPRGGIYFFFRIKGIDSEEFALRLLEKYRVAVAPGIDFGGHWREWIRITLARDENEIEEGLRRIHKLEREIRGA